MIESKKHYRIVDFVSENVKRLKLVRFEPERSLVTISGANESGKSSVLDSVWWALAGTKGVDIRPIRDGEESATIQLKLGNETAELTVIRTFTRGPDGATKTALVVETESGARYPSPQKVLDSLLGALAFDPLEFLRLSAKEQVDTLRRLVPIDVDVDALDAQNRADFENRTAINREVKRLSERVNILAAGIEPSIDITPVDESALVDAYERANDRNADYERLTSERGRIAVRISDNDRRAGELREQAAKIIAEAELLEETTDRLQEHDRDLSEQLAGIERVDTRELRRQMDDARKENAARRMEAQRRESHAQGAAEHQAAKDAADQLTAAIIERTEQKAAALARAKMPVPGLSFDDGVVSFGGVPLSQCSSAQQLRVSFAIAAAQDPSIRVARIKDGSLLDERSLKLVAELAEATDFQVWVERVDTSGKVGVHMVDGEIAP